MKRKFNNFICVFIFITLFVLMSNSAFAADPEEVLKGIIKESKVRAYSVIHNDVPTEYQYVFEPNQNVIAQYLTPEADGIVIDGVEYTFEISYTNENDDKKLCSDYNKYFVYYEETNNVVQHLKDLPTNGINVTYSLIPKDPSKSVISINDTLKVNTDSMGNPVPEEVVVQEFKEESIWGVSWNVFLASTGISRLDVTRLSRFIAETLCKLSIPFGDSLLYMICASIGEEVTIDKVVYNEVNRLNVDFFESGDSSVNPSRPPLKEIMSSVVNKFYSFFRLITVLVYMVILVYIGLRMILSSTAAKKADYKALFMAWIMGVVMLMFFPYVMKYSIKINNALCEWIGTYSGASTSDSGKMAANSVPPSLKDAVLTFGDDRFIMMMINYKDEDWESGDYAWNCDKEDIEEFSKNARKNNVFGNNIMMQIRFLAGWQLDLPLTIVYFILIGELLALLIIYYKRVFMLAFLISIFPLVMMLYPLNKIGQIRINCFGVWFKEFLVNVFVQTFHAVTYTVIVSVGVSAYLNSKNWLFMIMCILFLFEGEKIIRAIFNAKSSMNTIGDMAAAGIMAMNITKSATNFIPTFGKGKGDSDEENAADKAKQDRDKVRAAHPAGTDTVGAAANLAASASADGGTNISQGGTGGATADNSTPNITLGRNAPISTTTANKTMDKNIDDNAKKGLLGKTNAVVDNLGKGFSAVAQATGASVGLTFGMAQNDGKKGMDTAVAGAVSGMNAGKEVGTAGHGLITGATGRISKAYAGAVIAREYLNKERDDEIDFSGADAMAESGKQEAIRKAYARIALLKGVGMDNVAEIMLIKDRLERDKKN